MNRKISGAFIDVYKNFYNYAYCIEDRYFADELKAVELSEADCSNAIEIGDKFYIKDCGRNRSHLWIKNCPNPCLISLMSKYTVFRCKALPCLKPTINWMNGSETEYINSVHLGSEVDGFLFMSTKEITAESITIIRRQPSKSKKTERIWYWIPAKCIPNESIVSHPRISGVPLNVAGRNDPEAIREQTRPRGEAYLNVVGRIDLDALIQQTRPRGKNKEE